MYITLYIIITFFLSLTLFIKNKSVSNIAIFFILLCIAITLASRDINTGVDTISYLEIYNNINPITTYIDTGSFGVLGDKLEYLFSLWISLIKSIGGDFFIFLFFSYSIMLTVLLLAIKKLNVNASIFFICFFCSYCFIISYLNVFRQGMALSFIFLSFSFYVKDKKMQSIIILFFAGLIHSSAFLFMPFFFISKLLTKKINFNITTYFLYMSILLLITLVDKAIPILSIFTSIIPSNTSSRIIFYQATSEYKAPIYTPSFFLDFIFFLFFTLKVTSRNLYNDYTIKLSIIIYYLGLILYITISPIGIIAERLLLLFTIFQIFVWTKYFTHTDSQRNIKIIIMIISCIMFSLKNIYLTTKI
ncbi:EpsG family protein [Proteus vulgaris]|uniref:EpsG family protein n=1 Tax=Proteus mirabilis TaxID=584 RepID=UPI001373D159|nr:EpsG family protein [Proteus vulgaris]